MSKKCKLDSALTSSSSSFTNSSERVSLPTIVESKFENKQFIYLETPHKSPLDKKEYSVIRLANGLTALLITDHPVINLDGINTLTDESSDESIQSDSESENSISSSRTDSSSDTLENINKDNEEKIAACALCVNVGSFSDPEDIPGLAHFLEHMVFMGSEKYPTENEFDSFIKRKGGSDNASTECEITTFYFECHEEHLFKGMDIFCQFFISPLMKFEAITRERQAIESEFQLALPSDYNRKHQLLCSAASPDNPAHKFSWGNLITLRDNVTVDHLYDSVHKFRERHYSAHRMTLAVQARISQETLANWVVSCFSKVKNNNLPPLKHVELAEPFPKDLFCKLIYMDPVNDVCEVEMSWILPTLKHLYKSKPLEYISCLLGHAGKGSLLSYLRKKVWALDITTREIDDSESNSLFYIFKIIINLTEDGYQHLPDVIEGVFSYIKLLQTIGPVERIFKEMQSLSEMNFKYSDEITAIDKVEILVENMHTYPPEHYLTGPALFFEYNSESIKQVMDKLRPDNCHLLVAAKTVKKEHTLDQTEKWFGTKYRSVDIPFKWLTAWKNVQPNPSFHIPEPNQFITTDFSILTVNEEKAANKYPRKIKSDSLIELWFKEDTKFNLPQAYVFFYLISPIQHTTPMHSAMSDLFCEIIFQLVAEEAYPAVMAEMNYSILSIEKGFSITVHGYNQNLHLLLDKIIQGIVNFEANLTRKLFEAMKKLQNRVYINYNLQAGVLSTELRMYATLKVFWSILDKLKVLPDITYEIFKDFSRQLFHQVYIQALIQGNISEEQALAMSENVATTLKCLSVPASLIPHIRSCQLETGEKFIRANSFNTQDNNCVTTMYYQYGPGKMRECCILEMLQMLLEEPLFDTLRTQEQLGYDVSCAFRNTYGILGFSITVISLTGKCSMEHVEERINNFLETSLENFKKMTKKDFEEVVKSVIKLKQCSYIYLKEEVLKNWEEIKCNEYIFDRYQREVDILLKLKMEDVRSFLESQIGTNKKKLTVQVVGTSKCNSDDNETTEEIDYTVSNMNLQFINDVPGKPPDSFILDPCSFKRNLSVYPVNKIVD